MCGISPHPQLDLNAARFSERARQQQTEDIDMDATNNNIRSRTAANGITMLRGTVLVGLLMSTVLTSLPPPTFALEREDEGRHSLVQHPYGVRSLLTTLQTEVDVLKTQLSLMTGTNTSLQTALRTAQADIVTLQVRVKALEAKPSGGVLNLERYVTIDTNPINGVVGPHILITGANVHVRSGSGFTDDNISGGGTLTGLGNLIIGYNESNPSGQPRTGSHNLVGGSFNSFSSTGGMVFGLRNTLSGKFATIVTGDSNTASGVNASVLGGNLNVASGLRSTVYGGLNNTAANMNSYSPLQGIPVGNGN
jgi:hypothetical protein